MTTKSKPQLGRGEFNASQAHDTVILRAWGMAPTPGYKVWLEALPPDVFPPIFGLFWSPPSEPVPQVLVPFEVTTTFTSKERLTSLDVVDASGPRRIPVEWVPDKASASEDKGRSDELAYEVTGAEIIILKRNPPILCVHARGLARSGPSVGRLEPLPSIEGVAAFELRATRGPLTMISRISATHEIPLDTKLVEVKSERNAVRIEVPKP